MSRLHRLSWSFSPRIVKRREVSAPNRVMTYPETNDTLQTELLIIRAQLTE